MSWDEPTQEELDDAIVEDTVHCARCGAPHVLTEGHLSGDRSICEECTDDEIADLVRQRDEGKSRAEEDARRGRYSIDPLHARALDQAERFKAERDRLAADVAAAAERIVRGLFDGHDTPACEIGDRAREIYGTIQPTSKSPDEDFDEAHHQARVEFVARVLAGLAHVEGGCRPKVVTLCGSTRFAEEYRTAEREETLKGVIVISVGMFGRREGIDMESETKRMLDELHLRKIDLSDEILVINPGGYVGDSTRREIAYAERAGKPVRYLHPAQPPTRLPGDAP